MILYDYIEFVHNLDKITTWNMLNINKKNNSPALSKISKMIWLHLQKKLWMCRTQTWWGKTQTQRNLRTCSFLCEFTRPMRNTFWPIVFLKKENLFENGPTFASDVGFCCFPPCPPFSQATTSSTARYLHPSPDTVVWSLRSVGHRNSKTSASCLCGISPSHERYWVSPSHWCIAYCGNPNTAPLGFLGFT